MIRRFACVVLLAPSLLGAQSQLEYAGRRADLAASWRWFERRELHKLSAVDAVSFVLMTEARLREAFTFDHHFASAGFRIID